MRDSQAHTHTYTHSEAKAGQNSEQFILRFNLFKPRQEIAFRISLIAFLSQPFSDFTFRFVDAEIKLICPKVLLAVLVNLCFTCSLLLMLLLLPAATNNSIIFKCFFNLPNKNFFLSTKMTLFDIGHSYFAVFFTAQTKRERNVRKVISLSVKC